MNKSQFWKSAVIKSVIKKILNYSGRGFIKILNGLKQIFYKLKKYYMSKSKKARALIIAAAFILVGLILFETAGTNLSHNKTSSLFKDKINNIRPSSAALQMQAVLQEKAKNKALQTALQKIQQELFDYSLSHQKVQELTSQMAVLKKEIQLLKSSANAAEKAAAASNARLRKNEASENKRTKQMTKQLSKISKAVAPKKYLPPSVLPFQVVGVDFWNGKPMVSIAMKDINGVEHYRLMGLGMKFNCGIQPSAVKVCSSWTLHRLQTSPNEAVFINDKNQKVKIEF